MIYDISHKTKKIDPEHCPTIIYKGSEIIPNFDKNLTKMKKEHVAPVFSKALSDHQNNQDDSKAATANLLSGIDVKLKKKLSIMKKPS